MATDKPRITITLEPKAYTALKAFSEATGQNMSGFISQSMEGAIPLLKKLTALAIQAKNAMPAAKGEIYQNISKLLEVTEETKDILGDAVGVYTTTAETRDEAPAAALSPPISNRGGQNPPTGTKKGGKVVRLKDHRNAR